MAIHNFIRTMLLPVARYKWADSSAFPGQVRLLGCTAAGSTAALAVTPHQPRTAEFERDLQTFRDLCALTDPTT